VMPFEETEVYGRIKQKILREWMARKGREGGREGGGKEEVNSDGRGRGRKGGRKGREGEGEPETPVGKKRRCGFGER